MTFNTREIALQIVGAHGADVDASTIDEELSSEPGADGMPDEDRDRLVEEIHGLIQQMYGAS